MLKHQQQRPLQDPSFPESLSPESRAEALNQFLEKTLNIRDLDAHASENDPF
jgi:hypothetical protein